MSVLISKTISIDFSNGLNDQCFFYQISDSVILQSKFVGLQFYLDTIDIYFNANLTSPENDELDYLISIHDPDNCNEIIANVEGNTVGDIQSNGTLVIGNTVINLLAPTGKDVILKNEGSITGNLVIDGNGPNLSIRGIVGNGLINADIIGNNIDISLDSNLLNANLLFFGTVPNEFVNGSILSGSNKVSVIDDVANNSILLNIIESNIVHQNISGAGTNTHAQIDNHISSTTAHGATGAVVGTTNTQTLTNKTITSITNDVTAKGLHSETTTVSVSGATAPTTGQVLTATSSTNATWQTPNVFGSSFNTSENTSTTTTTSTSYVLRQRLTTTSLPSGVYRIEFLTLHRSSLTTTDVGVKVFVGSTELFSGNEFRSETRDTGTDQRESYTGSSYYTGSGVLDIDIRYNSQTGATSFIYYSRITIWRVS